MLKARPMAVLEKRSYFVGEGFRLQVSGFSKRKT